MFPQIGAVFAFWMLAAAALAAQAGNVQEAAVPTEGSAAMAPEPKRMAISVFGTTAEVEVRDLPAAEASAAIEETLTEIFTLDRLADPDGTEPGGVGVLNRAAGQRPQALDSRVAEILVRSLQFCIWSNGAYGPLGGELHRLWDSGEGQRPLPNDVRAAAGSAECNRLALRASPADPATTIAELAAGSRVDLRGMARGFAIDRAIEILDGRGAMNVWVEIGDVWRARGGGPDGRGWLATLPPIPGGDEPLDHLWLHDQALAFVSLEVGDGESPPGIIDQRTGVPARGVFKVIAVTELAVDVEPLVYALFVLGHREGHMRLGKLNPRPSVYWLLGQGIGQPLEATYRWSELERVRRR